MGPDWWREEYFLLNIDKQAAYSFAWRTLHCRSEYSSRKKGPVFCMNKQEFNEAYEELYELVTQLPLSVELAPPSKKNNPVAYSRLFKKSSNQEYWSLFYTSS